MREEAAWWGLVGEMLEERRGVLDEQKQKEVSIYSGVGENFWGEGADFCLDRREMSLWLRCS